MQKQKKCKGSGKAIGYGCGQLKFIHKFGICSGCFKEWLFSNDGLPYLNSTQIKAKIKVQSETRKEFSKKKEANRSKSYFEKQLEHEVNAIVRLIDSDKGCISCNHGWDKPWTRQAHAGHKVSVGSNPTLRYNLFNIFRQCSICNNWKSGNEREYDKGLITHYGAEMLEYIQKLPAMYKELHLSIEELKQAIINARLVKKEILSGSDYTREQINQRIEIYN